MLCIITGEYNPHCISTYSWGTGNEAPAVVARQDVKSVTLTGSANQVREIEVK